MGRIPWCTMQPWSHLKKTPQWWLSSATNGCTVAQNATTSIKLSSRIGTGLPRWVSGSRFTRWFVTAIHVHRNLCRYPWWPASDSRYGKGGGSSAFVGPRAVVLFMWCDKYVQPQISLPAAHNLRPNRACAYNRLYRNGVCPWQYLDVHCTFRGIYRFWHSLHGALHRTLSREGVHWMWRSHRAWLLGFCWR